jgi:hypothetical protein
MNLAGTSVQITSINVPIIATALVTCKSSMPVKAVEFMVKLLNPGRLVPVEPIRQKDVPGMARLLNGLHRTCSVGSTKHLECRQRSTHQLVVKVIDSAPFGSEVRSVRAS